MLPSVTRILSPWSDFSIVPPDVLAKASERGTRVHAACAAYAMDYPVAKLEDGDGPYFESFKVWFESSVIFVVSVENRFEDEILGFCGHPDLVCIIDGDGHNKSVVDLKTPRITSPSWRLQLSAYAHLTKAQRCFSLRLSPDGGKAIVDECKDWQRDFAIFLNALSVWRYYHNG